MALLSTFQKVEVATGTILFFLFAYLRTILLEREIDTTDLLITSILFAIWFVMTKIIVGLLVTVNRRSFDKVDDTTNSIYDVNTRDNIAQKDLNN